MKKPKYCFNCDLGLEPEECSAEEREECRKSYFDNVNHPSHYETGKFECIDVMVEALGKEKVMDFCLCNAFKYIYRCTRKNGIEDVKKADWYLNKLIELQGEGEK